MAKQFYEFGSNSFGTELLQQYARPAGLWLLGSAESVYLLPQAGGSNWECALAIEGLLKLRDIDTGLDKADSAQIMEECLETFRWMFNRLQWVTPDCCTWDRVTWDSAVCARVLIESERYFRGQLNPEESAAIETAKLGVVRWLVNQSLNWDRDIRYPAGPPDLAQVLYTLTLFDRHKPRQMKRIETSCGIPKDDRIHHRIARILLAMQQRVCVSLDDGEVELSYWVDCFNTSEVADGLTSYLNWCEDKTSTLFLEARAAVYRALRYIEVHQVDATWGDVAGTCGTLYGYLKVVAALDDYDAADTVVFRGLRWMCDEKQALDDGSFLHTTYVTVFYFHALLQALETWNLVHSSALEVYDVALWNAPVQGTAERSRRLELQLALEDRLIQLTEIRRQLNTHQSSVLFAVSFVAQLLLIMMILRVAGAWSADMGSFDLNLGDPGLFWTVAGIGLPIAITVSSTFVGFIRSRKAETDASNLNRESHKRPGKFD